MSPAKKFLINGKEYQVELEPDLSLLTLLRDHLGLTGTKYGCGEAQCGACTVLVDGVPTRSCVTGAEKVADKPITTIEGIATDRLQAVQEAFLRHGAFQCGYCTAGMIVEAVGLLRGKPSPTEDEILAALGGHICRCGTYPRILTAVKEAAGTAKEGGK